MFYGMVASVEKRTAGTQLVGAHSSGVSVLQVVDISDLPPTGTVAVGADTLTYIGVTDTDDPDGTATNDTLILSAPTSSGYADKASVTLTPTRSYKIALVVPFGSTVAIEVRVKHTLHSQMAEGQRQVDQGETVYVKERDGDASLILDDILGQVPTIDAGYLADASVTVSKLDPAVLALSTGSVDGGLL